MKKNDYVVVRTYSAGVFVGKLKKHKGKQVTLKNAIRLWSWSGAATLSQIAMEGVKNGDECKFAMPVSAILLTEVIEIISMTREAAENIKNVESWKE